MIVRVMFTKCDNCLSPIFDLKDMLHNSGHHGGLRPKKAQDMENKTDNEKNISRKSL